MGLALFLAVVPVLAADDAPSTNAVVQDPKAKAILMTMANFLAQASAFSVNVRSGYDAIQPDSQRIEFGEQRRILLQRPDLMRVEVQRSDGDRGMILFDGKVITAFKADDNIYACTEKPGTVDDVLVYLVKDLQMTLPLARMFHTGFPQQLEKMVTSIRYVEEDPLFDVPVDHLAVRSAEVDMQIWIAQGEKPLPRRVVLTYKNAPGEPQFWADLSGWELSPKVVADSFTFTPPAGAEKIPFVIPKRQTESIPAQKGVEK
jgi:hypothetical protein